MERRQPNWGRATASPPRSAPDDDGHHRFYGSSEKRKYDRSDVALNWADELSKYEEGKRRRLDYEEGKEGNADLASFDRHPCSHGGTDEVWSQRNRDQIANERNRAREEMGMEYEEGEVIENMQFVDVGDWPRGQRQNWERDEHKNRDVERQYHSDSIERRTRTEGHSWSSSSRDERWSDDRELSTARWQRERRDAEWSTKGTESVRQRRSWERDEHPLQGTATGAARTYSRMREREQEQRSRRSWKEIDGERRKERQSWNRERDERERDRERRRSEETRRDSTAKSLDELWQTFRSQQEALGDQHANRDHEREVFAHEEFVPRCLSPNNLHAYLLVIEPLDELLAGTVPTILMRDRKEYVFEGFYLLSHCPISVPALLLSVFEGVELTVSMRAVSSVELHDLLDMPTLDWFHEFFFSTILQYEGFLEPTATSSRLHGDGKIRMGCRRYHFLPRFVHREGQPDLLSAVQIKQGLLESRVNLLQYLTDLKR